MAGFVGSQSSPLLSIGESFIDATPGFVEAFAVKTFGSHDKALLLGGLSLGLIVVAAAIGVLALRRRVLGSAGIAALGLAGVASALTRPTATPIDAVPSLAGGAAGALAVWLLAGRAAAPSAGARAQRGAAPAAGIPARSPGAIPEVPAVRRPEAGPPELSRRGFLVVAAVAGGAAVVTGGAGLAVIKHKESASNASAASLRIPRPASPAPPVNPAWDLNIPGLTPFFTASRSFYRVDTELVVPQVSAATWRLRIHGMVHHPMTLTIDDLLARPLVERDITLSCVSNEVGGRYASNGRWIGARLKELLDEAGIMRGADQIASTSVDGWSSGTPTEVVMDGRDAMLAVALNGKPLPAAHGFPVRMLVPGVYGYANATKWIVDLEATTFARQQSYWARRGYAQQPPPVKTLSRIDTPAPLATIKPGPTPIAGIAWAQHRGIAKVEVAVDGGTWQAATLSVEDTPDTWRQFVWMWDSTPGEHTLAVRATDATGALQPEARVPPLPDGATGWDSVVITVAG
ncbi:MAG TPA: molybdopterin-dependent oxidoreductase [Actinomycetota bacterium]|nr:molybdopterin-dependent oxidoreductase [Actinomycetota bacterium]